MIRRAVASTASGAVAGRTAFVAAACAVWRTTEQVPEALVRDRDLGRRP
jgi:hypothetical protein